MGSKIISIIIIASLTMIGFIGIINFSSDKASAYTSHPPIFIDGNAEFRPVNGVTGGTGAEDNPFIIEGWEIDASTEDGIWIQNTDAYFIIRDCHVHSGSLVNDGIFLDNVMNGQIVEVLITDNGNGIFLISVTNLQISNNNISSNNGHGVFSMSSNEVNVVNNDFVSNSRCGVFFSRANDTIIDSNKMSENIFDGIRLDSFNDSEISDNLVTMNNNIGIYLKFSSITTMTGNVVSSNTWDGIYVRNSSYIDQVVA